MIIKLFSSILVESQVQIIEISIDIRHAYLPGFVILNTSRKTSNEVKEKLISGFRCNNFEWPRKKIVVTFSNQANKIEPLHFSNQLEFPIALGILQLTSQINLIQPTEKLLSAGEINISGEITTSNTSFTGLLETQSFSLLVGKVDKALLNSYPYIKLPEIFQAKKLADLQSNLVVLRKNETKTSKPQSIIEYKYSHIKGLDFYKRAFALAMSGGHNVLIKGPPGYGKSLLARGAIEIAPKLNAKEKWNLLKIASEDNKSLDLPPVFVIDPRTNFRELFHLKDNILTKYHSLRTILILEELPEIEKKILNGLKLLLDDPENRFLILATMNPCKCGYQGSTYKQCKCSAGEVVRYQNKITEAFLDRIDLILTLNGHSKASLGEDLDSKIHKLATQVNSSYERQLTRSKGMYTNGTLPFHLLSKLKLSPTAKEILTSFSSQNNISIRKQHKLLRLAQTIADFENQDEITIDHILEAIQYSGLKINSS